MSKRTREPVGRWAGAQVSGWSGEKVGRRGKVSPTHPLTCPPAHWPLFLMLLTFLPLLTACGGATVEPPAPVTLTIASVDSAGQLIQKLGDQFSQANPHISFEIVSANSTRSLEHLAAGKADIAVISNTLPGIEQFQVTPIAHDALLLVAHPDNPVDNLSLLELRQLYSGKVYDWRKTGGLSEDVQVVVRERGSGLKAVFDEAVMKGERITPNARIFPNGKAVINYAAQEQGAIGYVSAADASTLLSTGLQDALKIITLNDVSPAPENLLDQAYPLAYTLYAVTTPNAPPEVREFVDYLRSPAGQTLIRAQGMVTVASE